LQTENLDINEYFKDELETIPLDKVDKKQLIKSIYDELYQLYLLRS